jgi:ribosomal-protein-alanine N-acetyltransferase
MSEVFFLTTRRLGFRHWRAEDFDLALSLWGDPRVTRLIDARSRLTPEEVRERLEHEIRAQEESGIQYWPFFLLDSGEFAGCSGLKPYAGDPALLEMGFHLRHGFWGQGLATEAGRAVIAWAEETLHPDVLLAGHNPRNLASRRILQKLGFRHIRDELFSGTGQVHPLYELRLPAVPPERD